MAELHVRDELTVEEEGGADAGTQIQQKDDPCLALAGAIRNLGHPGGVGVIQHRDWPTKSVGQ